MSDLNLYFKNLYRISRAVATNLIAITMPGFYVRLTGQTGRGSEPETSADIAEYFWQSFHEYFQILGICDSSITNFLAGKKVLEYGPGDLPAVSWLMVAYGAEKAICVDRFPLLRISKKNREVLQIILHRLPELQRGRAIACLQDISSTGFNP